MVPPRKRLTTQTESQSSPVRLWAPWRSAYVASTRAPKGSGCIFCFDRITARQRRQRLILHSNQHALVMLNRYPYTSAHLMVAPRRHVASPELLERNERIVIDELIIHCIKELRDAMHPSGFNVGANLGRSAGAGVADHMHWHVVPRWDGDSNYMTTISSVRVLSQSLEQCFDSLAPRFKAIDITLS